MPIKKAWSTENIITTVNSINNEISPASNSKLTKIKYMFNSKIKKAISNNDINFSKIIIITTLMSLAFNDEISLAKWQIAKIKTQKNKELNSLLSALDNNNELNNSALIFFNLKPALEIINNNCFIKIIYDNISHQVAQENRDTIKNYTLKVLTKNKPLKYPSKVTSWEIITELDHRLLLIEAAYDNSKYLQQWHL